MKKVHIALVAALIVSVGMAYESLGGTEPEDGMIVGEAIDITGYAMFGRVGEEHIESGKYRAEHGFPVGIREEETGDVWIAVYRLPVPAAGLQTANKVLAPFMGMTVVAQGLKYRAEGVNLIRLSLVSEY